MGRPLRSGAVSSFSVTIRPQVKTCPEEVGIFDLTLSDGTKVVAIGHTYWPSHDRSLVETLKRYLAEAKPDLIFFLGGALHEEAFKQVVDDDDLARKLVGAPVPPELQQVMADHEGMEDRFLELARQGGRFIAEFAECSGAHLIYIPSVSGAMPNEIDIHRFVLEQKMRADAYVDRHPDEAKKGKPIPESWGEFLGLHKHPQITVLPFGAAVLVNGQDMYKVSDFKRRHPGSASKVDWEQTGVNVIRSYPGMVSSGWQTTPVHTMPAAVRNYHQFHEVGNMFSIQDGLGYMRTYERRAKGFWVGSYAGGKLFAHSVPFVPGKDGRRGFVLNGMAFSEETPGSTAKRVKLEVPSRTAKTAKPQGKPATKRKPAKKKSG
ncbi:MAG: hypothetical protein K2W95_05530 [Candidatus Obscuribacterales bacterium]|nr:hypothetical protein [Candidatus Obscuribacterales bacterium]